MAGSGLESLGFISGHDIQHRNLANQKQYEAFTYFDWAKNLLTQVTPVVLAEVVPKLEEYSGRWNPGGFMVFPLGLTKDGSSLRLHVSAAGLPRDVLNGPFIHNHGWHLTSRVLAGVYSDRIVDVQKQYSAVATDPENGLLRLYETNRNPNGLDILETDGTIVKATPIRNRVVQAGEFHTIEALNIYHIPTTPSEHLAATLVLDSPSFTNTTHVLLNNSEPITIERVRKPLKPESIAIAKEQLGRITHL